MSRKTKLFMLILTVITVSALWTVLTSTNPKKNTYRPGASTEIDGVVNQAQELYQTKKTQGLDFAKGPCLTNDLSPNWVADIVHKPRQKIDDLPENQCQAFNEGRALHFVELDVDGNVVRVK